MSNRIAQLQAILQAEPRDAFCLYGLAMEFSKSGRFDEAIEYYDRTLAVDPTYCYAYFHKARCQEEAGLVEAARETLRVGLIRARAIGDAKASSELAGYLDQLE